MSLRSVTGSSRRYIAKHLRNLSRLRTSPPPFPTLATCPSPTCACADTPAMPDGFVIDTRRSLNGTMAPYAEQILICTGQEDWKSRIEEENDGDNLAADLKELLGRGGIYSDPYHSVSITNSSLPPSTPKRAEIQTTSAYLFPSFKYIPFLPRVSFDSVQALTKGYLLPKKLHPAHDNLSPIHKDRLLRKIEYQGLLFGVHDVEDVMVLICGHGGRDGRCGVMGPALREEFERVLPREGVEVVQGPVSINEGTSENAELVTEAVSPNVTSRVCLISHIGGHKFAGNVIIYIPKKAKTSTGAAHPLAGCGAWYGRVEPKHVEGIVNGTILSGTVFEDLFRGGITQAGEILRL